MTISFLIEQLLLGILAGVVFVVLPLELLILAFLAGASFWVCVFGAHSHRNIDFARR